MIDDSHERLSAMIGGIYDAVIDPGRWVSALQSIQRHFDFYMIVLGASQLPSGASVLQVSTDADSIWANSLASYGPDFVRIWGGLDRLANMPLEEPILNTDAVPLELIRQTRFYQEWAAPQRIVNQVGMILARESNGLSAHAGLSIHEDSRPLTDDDMQMLRVLAPHLRRALTITQKLDAANTTATTFEAALSATRSAVVLVDENMMIQHANDAAAAMMRTEETISARGNRLGLHQELAPNHLRSAVAAAARDEATMGRRGLGLPARTKNGAPVAVNVMPLRRRTLAPDLSSVAAAVFVTDNETPMRLPDDTLQLLYDLTPAEQRVFELVVGGRSTDEIAAQLSIAHSTVRTHLLRIFAKTDRRNRAELILLSREMALPTR